MIFILIVCTAFSFLILKWKLEHKRYFDFTLDLVILIVLSYLFKTTITGMIIAVGASTIVSIYLLLFPPRL